jgi:hypothetical protein
MNKVTCLFLTVILMAAVTALAPAQIKVDGLFFDWGSKYRLDVAPNDESRTFGQGGETDPPRGSTDSTYFADCDVSHVYGTDDADFVYLRIQMSPIADATRIPTDTSYHGGASIAAYISVDPGPQDTTGLTWGWWGSGYDYFVQVFPPDTGMAGRSLFPQPLYEHNQTGNGWNFEVRDTLIGCQVAWNANNNEVELAIPKSLLLHPKYLPGLATPDSIAIMIYAGENESPWRADYACNAGVTGYMLKLKAPGAITIDGLMFEWQDAMRLDIGANTPEPTFGQGDDTDPPRGSSDSTYFSDLDLWHAYATDDEDFLYLRVTMSPIADVSRIPNDTSYHGGAAIAAYISVDPGAADTTGLTWGWWGNGYDYFVQAFPPDTATQAATGYQQAVWEHTQAGTGWDFVPADPIRGAWVAWNASNNEVEMAIPKVVLFNPHYLSNFVVPDEVAIMVYAGENESPWRADYASNAGVAGYLYRLTGTTAVAPGHDFVATGYKLQQNYPNPFNPATTIRYALPQAGWVTLRVYNVLGQEVATLVDELQNAGEHALRFNGANLSSGVYFYRLETRSFVDTRKMVLVK